MLTSGLGNKNGSGRWLDVGPEIKSFRGKTGASYLIFRTHDGDFHVYRGTDAREAALDCGAGEGSTGREMWEGIGESHHHLG